MKLNKKHLPFYAAFVQTAQYTLAGWLFMGWLGAICVGLMGALVSLSMAYATSQFSDIAQKRKSGSLFFLVALMAFSPILIGTATFLHLPQITNLIWRGVVCAAWGFLPDGATALAGFIAGRGLVEQSVSTGHQSGSSHSSRTNKPKQTSRQKKMTAIVPCKWGCGLKGTQAKMNGHSPFCTFNPANKVKVEVKQ